MSKTLDDWLEAVVESARVALDQNMGLTGATFRWVNGELHFTAMTCAGDVPDGLRSMFFRGPTHLSRQERELAYGPRPRPLELMSELLTRNLPGRSIDESSSFDALREAGVHDFVAAYGLDPSGSGYVLAAPAGPRPSLSKRAIARWSRLRAHLLAGLRLHTACTNLDAILSPAGTVVHAERTASSRNIRESLREAALRIDRARCRSRMSPDAALSTWEGLVSGRWSLIDQFDSDGRRYYIARRNDPALERPRPLSLRERQVLAYAALGRRNKEIAYELGLAPSTVSTHLTNAMRRLGITSRAGLARACTPGVREVS